MVVVSVVDCGGVSCRAVAVVHVVSQLFHHSLAGQLLHTPLLQLQAPRLVWSAHVLADACRHHSV